MVICISPAVRKVPSSMDLSSLNVSLVPVHLTSTFLKKKQSCFYTRHLLITQSRGQINGFILKRMSPAALLQPSVFTEFRGLFPFSNYSLMKKND